MQGPAGAGVAAGCRSSSITVRGLWEGVMSKSEDRKLEALVRKTAAKVANQKPKAQRRHDPTLPPETEDDLERRRFFAEMKKREF